MTHAELARLNLALAEQQASAEWTITTYFYAAVHAVDFLLFPGGHAPEQGYDHHQREDRLLGLGDRRLLSDYRQLKDLSRVARYMPWYHPMGPLRVTRAKHLAEGIVSRAKVP